MSKEEYDNIGKVSQPVKNKEQAWVWATDQIHNRELAKFVKGLLDSEPDEFYMKAASSTGKHHPKISRSEGGLYRHIMLAFKLAMVRIECCNSYYNFSEEDIDVILSSILLHDWKKYGVNCEEKNCPHEHPQIGADEIPYTGDKELDRIIERIKSAVACHSGIFTESNYSNVVLPLPSNQLEWFIHECDLLSGQKFYDVEDLDLKDIEYYNTKIEPLTPGQLNYITKLGGTKGNDSITGDTCKLYGVSKKDGIKLISAMKEGDIKFYVVGCVGTRDDYLTIKKLVSNYAEGSVKLITVSEHTSESNPNNITTGLFVAYRGNTLLSDVAPNRQKISASLMINFLKKLENTK